MPVSKKRKINRKDGGDKRYTMVQFTSELFDDGETFTFPDQKHMSLKLIAALNEGDVGVLIAWLAAAKVDSAEIDAIGELEQGEIEDFMTAWGKGSAISLPK